jgi:hypothetical protein
MDLIGDGPDTVAGRGYGDHSSAARLADPSVVPGQEREPGRPTLLMWAH